MVKDFSLPVSFDDFLNTKNKDVPETLYDKKHRTRIAMIVRENRTLMLKMKKKKKW